MSASHTGVDKFGGILPETRDESVRARNADLITLPFDVKGTNCGNCMYFKKSAATSAIEAGFCSNPRVDQIVSSRMCCAVWDSPKAFRSWKK